MAKSWKPTDSTVITIRLPQSLLDRADACTFMVERKRSELIREWIESGVAAIEEMYPKNVGQP